MLRRALIVPASPSRAEAVVVPGGGGEWDVDLRVGFIHFCDCDVHTSNCTCIRWSQRRANQGDSRVLVLEIRDKENTELDGMRKGSKMGRCETSGMEILAKRPLMFVPYGALLI